MTLDELDQESDPQGVGLLQDFTKPKMFTHFDAFDLDASVEAAQFTGLKYDDSVKHRASIILDAYEQQILDIDPETLNFEDKKRYENVSGLLNALKSVKIVDAQVLLKIFNLHRCQLWLFSKFI